MGISPTPRSSRGILFPTASTTQCHGCFFPTWPEEQCFQLHFPVEEDKADPGNWSNLSECVSKEECYKLMRQLQHDDWDESYLEPLENVTHAVRIGFCLLEPPLQELSQGRIVLVGDAAHPPVPYIGQGAQMGLEDVGVICGLLQQLMSKNNNKLDIVTFARATRLFEELRIPRTREILAASKRMGKLQQRRSIDKKYNEVKEELIQRDVFFHETLPVMFTGATYDYKEEVKEILEKDDVVNN